MEEIIKPKDYVRTHNGRIYKVTNVYILKITCGHTSLRYSEITKHSPNIIDLIEVGDILKIEEDGDIGYIGWEKDTTTLSYKEMIEDIKNGKVKLLGIVTHQQFNSIKYEVI